MHAAQHTSYLKTLAMQWRHYIYDTIDDHVMLM